VASLASRVASTLQVASTAPVPQIVNDWFAAALASFGHSIADMVSALGDTKLRERLERNLSEEERNKVNAYRANLCDFCVRIQDKSGTLVVYYERVVKCTDGAFEGKMLEKLDGIDFKKEMDECQQLKGKCVEVLNILKKAGKPSFATFFRENWIAIAAFVAGTALICVPGMQFGIPIWLEAALTLGGAVAGATGILSVEFASQRYPDAGKAMDEFAHGLETLRKQLLLKLTLFRQLLHDFNVKKELSRESMAQLKALAREMADSSIAVRREATQLEILAQNLPVFHGKSSCNIM
jgi:hypothetical protein